MIKIENAEVVGWEHAIRGMRNPMNSWDKSDSNFWHDVDCGEPNNCSKCDSFGNGCCKVGDNDLNLMKQLASAGNDHAKFMRMIVVYADIVAPLYWWKEFDTYKVGTVANSCSTRHKIHEREIDINDFSTDQMDDISKGMLKGVLLSLNRAREEYINTKDKNMWYQMIQLLPSSYNQRRTVMLNYQVLKNMYHARKNHKLNEWHDFCAWIESLPYSELMTETSGRESG